MSPSHLSVCLSTASLLSTSSTESSLSSKSVTDANVGPRTAPSCNSRFSSQNLISAVHFNSLILPALPLPAEFTPHKAAGLSLEILGSPHPEMPLFSPKIRLRINYFQTQKHGGGAVPA